MRLQELRPRIGCVLAVLIALQSQQHAIAQKTPVVSFDAAEVQDDEKARKSDAKNEGTPKKLLSFNFRFAPWEDVLKTFAERADLTLDLTEVPSGTFNYFDKGKYTPREALDILNGYLLQRGYALVRRDRFLVCVNTEKGIPANLIPLVPLEDLPEYGDNELISVIFSDKNVDAAQVVSQLEKLLGSHGEVTVMAATNSFVVTDVGRSVRLVQRLLAQGTFSGPAATSTGLAFRVFEMRHVPVAEADRLIRVMFRLPAADAAPSPGDLTLAADVQNNRLFITASGAQLKTIEQIVEAVDVPRAADDRPRAGASSTVRILPVRNADVIVIGRALGALSPRIRVSTTESRAKTQPLAEPGPEPARSSPAEPPAQPKMPTGAEGRAR